MLDRAIAERGRFPAIDLLRSVSRSLPDAASPEENAQIRRARKLLGAYDRAEMMIRAGFYASGSDPALDGFIAQEAPDGVAGSFKRLQAALTRA